MTVQQSFRDPFRAAIIGASGGIGGALVECLAADPRAGAVYAYSRSGDAPAGRNVITGRLDVCDEASIEAAAALVGDEPLDLVIVATGILHRGDALRPEKTLADIDGASFAEVYAVNATGPALVAKHFLPLLGRHSKSVFAALSARVGSIGDNRLGGWVAYRSSKAALNMILKTLSIEHARRRPQSCVVGLHPGTVDTRLSQPFRRGVAPGGLFAPDAAAKQLLAVIDGLRPADTGRVFAWDGTPVPE